MATRSGGAPAAPELGAVGRELVMRLLSQQEGEPAHTLAGMLANAYGALIGGDVATAQSVLGEVMAPAFDLERALLTLQQAQREAMDSAASLANSAPVEINADVAFSAPQLDTWREALEASVAAQMDVIERLKIVQQLAQARAAAPERVGA